METGASGSKLNGRWPLDGMDAIPLGHLLWRLAEQSTTVFEVRITSACEWSGCALTQVEWRMRLDPQRTGKPAEAACPLCGKPMRILAAGPLNGTVA